MAQDTYDIEDCDVQPRTRRRTQAGSIQPWVEGLSFMFRIGDSLATIPKLLEWFTRLFVWQLWDWEPHSRIKSAAIFTLLIQITLAAALILNNHMGTSNIEGVLVCGMAILHGSTWIAAAILKAWIRAVSLDEEL